MDRRTFLATAGSSLAASVAGCLTEQPEEDDEHACTRETWSVVLYNESTKRKSITVTITDGEDQVVFSDTLEVDPDTDQSTGIELETEVYYGQSYIFEASLAEADVESKETVVSCGDVYIFVTESGEVIIRDDSHEGD